MVFEYDRQKNVFILDDYYIEVDDLKELKDDITKINDKLNNICDNIQKLFNKFEHGLLYGVDDYLPEAVEQDLLESDEEFDIEVETKTLFSFEQEV